MTCKVCTKANANNKFNASNGGSTSYRKDKVDDHAVTKTHKLSKETSLTIHQLPSDIIDPVGDIVC